MMIHCLLYQFLEVEPADNGKTKNSPKIIVKFIFYKKYLHYNTSLKKEKKYFI